jgi:hypothetical protein
LRLREMRSEVLLKVVFRLALDPDKQRKTEDRHDASTSG